MLGQESYGSNLLLIATVTPDAVLIQARNKLMSFNQPRLQAALDSYGNMATRKHVREWLVSVSTLNDGRGADAHGVDRCPSRSIGLCLEH